MLGLGVKMVRQKGNILLSFIERTVSQLSKVVIFGWRKIWMPWAKKAGMPLASVLRLGRYSKIRNPKKSFSF